MLVQTRSIFSHRRHWKKIGHWPCLFFFLECGVDTHTRTHALFSHLRCLLSHRLVSVSVFALIMLAQKRASVASVVGQKLAEADAQAARAAEVRAAKRCKLQDKLAELDRAEMDANIAQWQRNAVLGLGHVKRTSLDIHHAMNVAIDTWNLYPQFVSIDEYRRVMQREAYDNGAPPVLARLYLAAADQQSALVIALVCGARWSRPHVEVYRYDMANYTPSDKDPLSDVLNDDTRVVIARMPPRVTSESLSHAIAEAEQNTRAALKPLMQALAVAKIYANEETLGISITSVFRSLLLAYYKDHANRHDLLTIQEWCLGALMTLTPMCHWYDFESNDD
jgi:hypothetical protein